MIEEKVTNFYTCKMDAMFKTVFIDQKNPRLLEAVLSCVLGGKPKIISWPTTTIANTTAREKSKNRDLVVELNGTIINLEVETGHSSETRSKLFTYHASMWKQNILRGEKYDTKTLFLQIVLQFGLSPSKELIREYKMQSIDLDTKKVDIWVKNFKTIEVNMARLKKLWYDNSREDIEKYKYLMMIDMNEEELMNLRKLKDSDKIVEEYTDKVSNLNRNWNFINTIGKEKEREYEFNTKLELACEAAAEKGRSETRLENAKKLIQDGFDKARIIKSLDLSKDEVKSLEALIDNAL